MQNTRGGRYEAKRTDKNYYKNQGCWDGIVWGGVAREIFVFRDSLQVASVVSACDLEGTIWKPFETVRKLAVRLFAGIVCVADVKVNIPVPSMNFGDEKIVSIHVRGQVGLPSPFPPPPLSSPSLPLSAPFVRTSDCRRGRCAAN